MSTSSVTRSRSGSAPADHPKGKTPVSRAHIPKSNQGTIGLSVKPSSIQSMKDSTLSVSSMTQKDHPHSITYTSRVRYDNKWYSCTILVPTLKPSKELTAEERTELENLVEEHKALFLKDLEQKAKNQIRGGQDFKVLFTEKGYVAYVPSTDQKLSFDPEIQSLEEAKKGGYFQKSVSSEDEIGQTLSLAFSSGNATKMKELLDSPTLSTLKSYTKPSANKLPVGLVRDKLQCYFNTAFLHWATNDIIREELLKNPNYFKNGAQNQLYRALKQYQEHREKGVPYDLNELMTYLNFPSDQQGYTGDVLNAFTSQLDYTQIPKGSPLYSKTKRTSYCQEQGDTVETTVVKRDEEPCLASRIIPLKAGENIETLLAQQSQRNTNVDRARLASGLYKPLKAISEEFERTPDVLFVMGRRVSYQVKEDQKEALKKVLLEQQWSSKENIDQDLLTKQESVRQILGKEAENYFEPRKIEDEIDVDLPNYDLTSFTRHEGTAQNGHYIFYVKKGSTHLEINDEKVRSIEPQEFLNHARQGCEWVYNKKGIASSSSEKGAKSQNEILETTRSFSPKIEIESGTLLASEKEFALVNPTDSSIETFHSEFNRESLEQRTNAAKEAAAKEKWFSTNRFTLESGNILVVPAKQEQHAVLHVIQPKTSKEVLHIVEKVLSQAQEKKIQNIAFPLFTCDGVDEAAIFKQMQKAIVQFAEKTKDRTDKIKKIKIILTPEQAKKIFPSSIKADPSQKTKTILTSNIGVHQLHITQGPPTGQTPLPSLKTTNIVDDLKAALEQNQTIDLREGMNFDLRSYPLHPSQVLQEFELALDQHVRKKKEKSSIRLILPENLKIDIPKWKERLSKLDQCLKVNPVRNGNVESYIKLNNVEFAVETAEDQSSLNPNARYSIKNRCNLIRDQIKHYPDAEYVFDLRQTASDVTVNAQIFSIKQPTTTPSQTVEEIFQELIQNPPSSKIKIRIVLPAGQNFQNLLKTIPENVKKLNQAISKESDDSVVLPVPPSKPDSPGMWSRFWNGVTSYLENTHG